MTVPNESEYSYHPKYRADIDGLRAVAIIIVVGYHAFPSWGGGGFIGVDIFFVISGYLISTLIFSGLKKQHFSFVEFYSRRMRRILPALLLVLASVYAVGWFTLFPIEYGQLGKHVVGGATSIENLLYWIESGYFDEASPSKPLLHLWSLGVEEQFYLIWPFILWAAWTQRINILVTTIVIGTTSFAVAIASVTNHPTAAFYSPLARFWELMLGAALAYLRAQPQRFSLNIKRIIEKSPWATLVERHLCNITSLAGAAIIAVGVLVINDRSAFPGWWSLMPTSGAALLIAGGPVAWLNRTVLASRLMVWFGLISYPLYLWHWPLLSFARILDCETPAVGVRIAAILAAVTLAWLTYRLVERPIRFGSHGGRKIVALLVVMSVMIVMGGYTYLDGGLPRREIANRNDVSSLLHYGFPRPSDEVAFWKNSCFLVDVPYTMYAKNGCEINRFANRPKVFFVGDSFSGFLGLGLRQYLLDRRYNLSQFSAASCTPLSLKDRNTRCQDIARYILERIRIEKPDILIFFAAYAGWQDLPQYGEPVPYDRFVLAKMKQIQKMGVKKIYIVGENTLWKDYLPKIVARKFVLKGLPIPMRTSVGVDPQTFEWDKRMKDLQYPSSVTYIPLIDYLCDSSKCLTMVGPNPARDLISFDPGHLTEAGAKYITANILAKYIH